MDADKDTRRIPIALAASIDAPIGRLASIYKTPPRAAIITVRRIIVFVAFLAKAVEEITKARAPITIAIAFVADLSPSVLFIIDKAPRAIAKTPMQIAIPVIVL